MDTRVQLNRGKHLKRIAIVGNLNIDNVIDADGNVFIERIGGNAIYASSGARMWNESVSIISRIPENYPSAYLKLLRDFHIDISQVRKLPYTVVLREWFCYEPDGSRIDQIFAPVSKVEERWPSIRTGHCGLNEKEAVTNFIRNYQPSADEHSFADFRRNYPMNIYELANEDYYADGFHITPNLPAEQEICARYAKTKGAVVMLDPQPPHTEANREILFRLLKYVDIFMPSQMELELFCPDIEMHKALKCLAEEGPKVTGVKLGADGCLIYDRVRDRFAKIPAFPATPVNLTGAGDCFCGGFLSGYLETGDPFAAAEYGTAAASIKIGKTDMEDIFSVSEETAKNRLAELKQMISRS